MARTEASVATNASVSASDANSTSACSMVRMSWIARWKKVIMLVTNAGDAVTHQMASDDAIRTHERVRRGFFGVLEAEAILVATVFHTPSLLSRLHRFHFSLGERQN